MKVDYKSILLILFLILIIDCLSFAGYFYKSFSAFVCLILFIGVLCLGLYKIEYGLYILFLEILTGAQGRWFNIELFGLSISLRMCLFTALILAFILSYFKKSIKIRNNQFNIYFVLVYAAILAGIINALINKNVLANIFADANAWLFFLVAPIILLIIYHQKQIHYLLKIFFIGTFYVAIRSIILFYLFAHNFFNLQSPFYKWLKFYGITEATPLFYNFWRIFSPAQIYLVIGFLTGIALLVYFILNKHTKYVLWLGYYLLFSGTALFISFSRSFWLGLIAGFITFLFLIWSYKIINIKLITKIIILLCLIIFAQIILIYSILLLPPQMDNIVNPVKILSRRAQIISEPAAVSRLHELKPLFREIIVKPFLGYGFGKTITYQSVDPRIIEKYGSFYTTYAFEWGYLEMWLKLGLFGLMIYLLLIYKIWQNGIKIIQEDKKAGEAMLIIGLLSGLVALCSVHFFSPYLNHPLGITYIVLLPAIFRTLYE